MIDSTMMHDLVTKSLNGESIALQTVVLVAVLEAVSLFKKYGPFIITFFRGSGSKVKKANGYPCPVHADLMANVTENIQAIRDLSARANDHHEAQRSDLSLLRKTIETDIRELRENGENNGRVLAQHDVAISFLRERSHDE